LGPDAGSIPGKVQKGPPPVRPKGNLLMAEGKPIVLGDEGVMPIFIPGHKRGSMGFIFRVKEGRSSHLAAIFAGSFLKADRIPDEDMQQFRRSIIHFEQETRKAKVDVELQNHPLMDNFTERFTILNNRQPDDQTHSSSGRPIIKSSWQ
jgi:hypothetical protein